MLIKNQLNTCKKWEKMEKNGEKCSNFVSKNKKI